MRTFTRVASVCILAGTLTISTPAGASPAGGGSAGTVVDAHVIADAPKQRSHIEARARSQIGAPYSYGGGSPSGFDCSGFTRWVYLEHGANLPHSSDAQFELAGRNGYKRVWDRADLHVGDLVFHDTDSGRIGHVGIYVGGGRFISATSSEGVQVRSLYDSYWGPRWVGATRVPATQE